MRDERQSCSVNHVVGSVARDWRLGHGLSQDSVAQRLREHGLPWSRSVVAALEAGNKTVDLAEFILLCYALVSPPAEWFEGRGPSVQLSPGNRMEMTGLRRLFSGDKDWRPEAGEVDTPYLPLDSRTLNAGGRCRASMSRLCLGTPSSTRR